MSQVTPVEYVFWLMGAHNGVGLLGNGLLYLVYHFGLFEQYKLQPNKWPEEKLVRKALIQYIIESYIIFPLLGYFVLAPLLLRTAAKTLPSWPVIAAQLVGLLLLTDCLFYWAHRTLHHPSMYYWTHKKHHEFKVTIGIAFEYSHPLETATNIASVLLGPWLFGIHPYVAAASVGIRMWESVDCHSGFNFPWYISPWGLLRETARHDFHHSKNMGSYGIFALWDKLMGTAAPFEEHKKRLLEQGKNTSNEIKQE